MAERYATVDDLPPEFAGVALATRQYWLNHTEVYIGVDIYGRRASQAHAQLAAHFLSRSPGAASEMTTAPAVIRASRAVGPVSTSFATAPLASHIETTQYGLAYKDIRDLVFTGPVLV